MPRPDIREFRYLVEDYLRTGWTEVDAEMATEFVAKYRGLISERWRHGKGHDAVAAEIVLLEFPPEEEDEEEDYYREHDVGRPGGFGAGHAPRNLDLRKSFDERTRVEGGTLYRKGNVVQVWWDEYGKETWTAPDEGQARGSYEDMADRWGRSPEFGAAVAAPIPIGDLRKRVNHWLAENLSAYAVTQLHWYGPKEWADQGEPYGNDAAATVLIEGTSLHTVLNYPETDKAFKLYDAFYAFVNSLGYVAELGYTWSLHFYPQKP
jgi:hypothetical protein